MHAILAMRMLETHRRYGRAAEEKGDLPTCLMSFTCTLALMGIIIFGVIGKLAMDEFNRYDHKHTGLLIYCYGNEVTRRSRYGTETSNYVDRIYSYPSNGSLIVEDANNCTLQGHTTYSSLANAWHAAEKVSLGTLKTLYVSNINNNVCIDSAERRGNYVLGLSCLLCIPGLCLISACCCVWAARSQSHEQDGRRQMYLSTQRVAAQRNSQLQQLGVEMRQNVLVPVVPAQATVVSVPLASGRYSICNTNDYDGVTAATSIITTTAAAVASPAGTVTSSNCFTPRANIVVVVAANAPEIV